MTGALLRLYNLTPTGQRLIAIGLAGLFATILICPLVYGIYTFLSLQSTVVEDRITLGRLQQFLHADPTPSDVRATTVEPDPFLYGQSLSMVQADLQTKVTNIARTRGILPASISNAAQLEKNHVGFTGVRVVFQGSFPALLGVIGDLESANPPLLITDATIRSAVSASETELRAPLAVNAEISVYGATDPTLHEPASTSRP